MLLEIDRPRKREYNKLGDDVIARTKEVMALGVSNGEKARLLGISVANFYYRQKKLLGPGRHRLNGRSVSRENGNLRTHQNTVEGRRRFEAISVQPDQVIPLKPDATAIVNGRTVFPTTVVSAVGSPRLLVSGRQNRKIGEIIEKGGWAGFNVYTLTLEERATCPTACAMWRTCYGNAMHMARRHKHGLEFEMRLRLELQVKGYEHPKGFVVRTHVLGDFYSVEYVKLWREMLDKIPSLHVYGYTARSMDDPASREIALEIARLKWTHPDRFRVRWSRPTSVPDGTVVIPYMPEANRVRQGLVCPVETEDAACCATCTLCWSAPKETIVFVAHGMMGRKRRSDDGAINGEEAGTAVQEQAV